MREHKHKCTSKHHEGARVRLHFDDRCTEPYIDNCLECDDLETGGMWEYGGDQAPSDADPGL